MNIHYLSLFIIFILAGTSPLLGGAQDIPLLSRIQKSDGKTIGQILHSILKEPVSPELISETLKLMDNRDVIFRDSEGRKVVEVRDIAFLILENLSGSNFVKYLEKGKTFHTKIIFSYLPPDEDVYRWTISSFSESEMERIRQFGEYWYEGYLRGMNRKNP